jgi:hypothetical protein
MASHGFHQPASGERLALRIIFFYPFVNAILVLPLVRIGQAKGLHLDPVGFRGEPGTVAVLLSTEG